MTAILNPKDWIAGLERGLKVLESFGEGASRMTAQQMADRTGLSRTAARRQLLTLEYLGYLASDGKLFWLTPRVLRLAQGYIDSSRLARIVHPYLQRLAHGLHETAYLSVFDNGSVIYLARQSVSRAKNVGYGIGEQVAAPLTAAGLMLLSYLSDQEQAEYLEKYQIRNFTSHTISAILMKEPRSLGFAISESQFDIDYRGIAVPILDHKGIPHGALSVTVSLVHESREDSIKRLLPMLRDTAVSLRSVI
jgi:IclR family pca regulon transcriptional regulator